MLTLASRRDHARRQSRETVQRRPAPLARRRPTVDELSLAASGSPVQLARLDAAVAQVHGLVNLYNHDVYGDMIVQCDGGGDGSSEEVQAAAAAGVRGRGQELPYLPTIQEAFGRHDVTSVQAHLGGHARDAAEAMGAEAYATGDHVAFRGAPDLHTAAHEAAHVVQQRAGVALKGGVGQVGDAYERHADAVADAVVGGRSAERILDQMSGQLSGDGRGRAVQRSEQQGNPGKAAPKLTKAEADVVVKQLMARSVLLNRLETQLTRNEQQLGRLADRLREEGARLDFTATLKGELATFSMRLDFIRGFAQGFPDKAIGKYMEKASGVAAVNELTNAADWRLNLVWGLYTSGKGKDPWGALTSIGTAIVGAQVEKMRAEGDGVSDQIEYIEKQRTAVALEIHKTKNADAALGKQLAILAPRDFDKLMDQMNIEGPYKAIDKMGQTGQQQKVQKKASGRSTGRVQRRRPTNAPAATPLVQRKDDPRQWSPACVKAEGAIKGQLKGIRAKAPKGELNAPVQAVERKLAQLHGKLHFGVPVKERLLQQIARLMGSPKVIAGAIALEGTYSRVPVALRAEGVRLAMADSILTNVMSPGNTQMLQEGNNCVAAVADFVMAYSTPDKYAAFLVDLATLGKAGYAGGGQLKRSDKNPMNGQDARSGRLASDLMQGSLTMQEGGAKGKGDEITNMISADQADAVFTRTRGKGVALRYVASKANEEAGGMAALSKVGNTVKQLATMQYPIKDVAVVARMLAQSSASDPTLFVTYHGIMHMQVAIGYDPKTKAVTYYNPAAGIERGSAGALAAETIFVQWK